MEKKSLLAIVLSVVVLFVFQSYFAKTPEGPVPDVSVIEDGAIVPKIINTITGKSPEDDFKPEKKLNIDSNNLKEYTFNGSKYEAVFSNLGGGGFKSFKLKHFKESIKPDAPMVERVKVEKNDPLPQSLTFSSNDTQIYFDELFDFEKISENEFLFKKSTKDGLKIERRYLLDSDSYKIDVDIVVINETDKAIEGTLKVSLFEREFKDETDSYNVQQQIVKIGEEIEKTDYSTIREESPILKGNINWFALEEKYFITAIILKENSAKRIIATDAGGSLVSSTVEFNELSIPKGGKATVSYSVYSGPKEMAILKTLNVGLEESVDMGWFKPLAEPLLRFLLFINKYTGNYGYSIIIVTILIKLLFFPLASKSYKSMGGMKKLQPQMTALKEKYKDDKARMSKEVMALYKKNKVNPLSGCLPMIVQIPVFIALYNVLLNTIDIRHAPFHFWIMDLSAKDPYYVTPIIMGVTMFLQQKLSPSVPDAMQQKIMMFMPIIFTAMFINLPSGLVLYWVINNILSIGQQYYIMKKM